MWKKNDFWMPRYKYDLVDWLTEHYWRVHGVNSRSKFERMNKGKLYKIYILIRQKGG